MKYKIAILTEKGPITVIFDSLTQSLERFEIELKQKYGNFVTLHSQQIG